MIFKVFIEINKKLFKISVIRISHMISYMTSHMISYIATHDTIYDHS